MVRILHSIGASQHVDAQEEENHTNQDHDSVKTPPKDRSHISPTVTCLIVYCRRSLGKYSLIRAFLYLEAIPLK